MSRAEDWGDIPEIKTKKSSGSAGSSMPPLREEEWKSSVPGIELLKNIGHALRGGAAGVLQGGSDVGRNIAQFPSDIYSFFTGNEGYQAPRSDYFKNLAPQSEIGQGFEKAGEFAAPFVASPGIALEANLGKTMFGGKLLPRLITDMLTGAAESEDRALGGALGAAAPAIGKTAKYIKETPFTKRGATKKLEKARELAGEESLGIPFSMDFLRNMEYQLGSPHLKPSRMQINNLMANAAAGTYPGYHALQSGLGDISRELMYPTAQKGKGILGMLGQYLAPPQSSAAERLTGRHVEEMRRQYIQDAMTHLKKTGKGKIADLATKGSEDYSRFKRFEPARNRALTLAILGALPGAHYLKNIIGHD